MPITTALITSENVGLNIGKRNILAPVAMNNGGKIIFFASVGFFVFFTRIKLTTTTISNDAAKLIVALTPPAMIPVSKMV